MAPIDIVIDLIKDYKSNVEEEYRNSEHTADNINYYHGKLNACVDILTEFEGFKKLFS